MKKSTLWFKFNLAGDEWEVHIVECKEERLMEDLEGVTLNTEAKILINANLAPSKRHSVLMHELLHACNFAIGLEKVGSEVFGAPLTDAREEALVSMLTPILFDTLARNGWLHLPKTPKI